MRNRVCVGTPGHPRWTGHHHRDRRKLVLPAQTPRRPCCVGAMGLRRDKSGDASKERLPGGGRSSECCHTPPDTTAVRAARHDSSVGVLGGLQHDPADRIPALDG